MRAVRLRRTPTRPSFLTFATEVKAVHVLP